MEETKHAVSGKHVFWNVLVVAAGMWGISWWLLGRPPSWIISVLIVLVSGCLGLVYWLRLPSAVRATLAVLLFLALALLATPPGKPEMLLAWGGAMIAFGIAPYLPTKKNKTSTDGLPVITIYIPLVITGAMLLVIYLMAHWGK